MLLASRGEQVWQMGVCSPGDLCRCGKTYKSNTDRCHDGRLGETVPNKPSAVFMFNFRVQLLTFWSCILPIVSTNS
jgi:hypothetical protein